MAYATPANQNAQSDEYDGLASRTTPMQKDTGTFMDQPVNFFEKLMTTVAVFCICERMALLAEIVT